MCSHTHYNVIKAPHPFLTLILKFVNNNSIQKYYFERSRILVYGTHLCINYFYRIIVEKMLTFILQQFSLNVIPLLYRYPCSHDFNVDINFILDNCRIFKNYPYIGTFTLYLQNLLFLGINIIYNRKANTPHASAANPA